MRAGKNWKLRSKQTVHARQGAHAAPFFFGVFRHLNGLGSQSGFFSHHGVTNLTV